jgi:CRP-like cAMP-binding protein
MEAHVLISYIQSVLPMNPEATKEISSKFDRFELSKTKFIVKENHISASTYFLESGLIRSYTFDDNGKEITTNIFSAPCFVNDFLSFFTQQPARENYQTLTNCVLWKTNLENVQRNFHDIPEFREFSRLLFVINYYRLQDRMLGMVKESAALRYSNLLNEHPKIFQHVSLKIIASYLGITDTSLSRIRTLTVTP